MASLLNIKFAYETGRGLTDANLNYIASKIYRNSRIADFSNEVMTFEMFWKEQILEGKYTFWEWFYNVMRLTTEYLAGPWKDGHIDGFVSKLEVDSYLKTTGNGTFMCRFSDSKLGGVSVSHRDSSHHDGVVHTRPFTSRDLQIRSFSSLILDKDIWTRLIPDQPKEDLFRKYSETENAKKSTGDYFGYEQFVWTIKTMYGDNKERNDSAVQNEDIDIEADREQSLQNWIDRAVESWGIEDTDMTT